VHKVKRACLYCLHKLWLTLAGVLVLLAVLISVLRYTLPYAEDYKHQIEQLLTERYGSKVQIAQLSAGWQKYGPALLLQQVSLYNTEQQLQLSVAETRVRLDFWRSLFNRQLIAQHFELSGLKYYLDADSLLARNDNTKLDPAPVLAALETFFFQQLAYFSVVDSQLVLQNEQGPDLLLNIKQLDWANSGNHHQGYGQLSLAGVTANTVSFILDLQGATLAEAFGQLYLQSERLDVLPWFARIVPSSQKLQQANINFKAWGRIDNGLLRRFQVELADNSLSWQRDGKAHTLRLGQGQLLWQPIDGGWSLTSGALTLAAQQQQWPDLQLQLQQQDGNWQGSLTNFQLETITPLANLLADDIDLLQQLMVFQPSGHLQQLQWQLKDKQWQAVGQFDDLHSRASGDIPGVSALAGDFLLSNDLIKFNLHAKQGELSWDGLFNAATPYDTLRATAYLQRTANEQWRLVVPTLSLHSADLQLDASLQLDNELSILARLQQLDAANASRYFPQRYMPDTVRDYLQRAIVQGRVQDARMLWHGVPSEFPYAEQQGVFQVLAELDSGEFAFAPDWPALQQLEASLWFENASMRIDAQQADLAGIAVTPGVSASIADLFHADNIDIHIRQQVAAEQLTALMLQSPLQQNLGKTLQHLGPLGQLQGDVLLEIGLTQAAVRASGSVDINGAVLQLAAPQMQLDNVNGRITFDNGDIKADALSVVWRGLPISAALQGAQTEQSYQLNVQLAGEAGAEQLSAALYAPVAELLSGSSAWQLKLTLDLAQQGLHYAAQLHSTLADTALHLPAPFAKAAGELAELTVTANGDADRSWLTAHYNDQLHFHAELQHDNQQIRRAHLIAGGEDTGLNGNGFSVSIDLTQADFLTWFELIQQQLNLSGASEHNIMPPLSQLRGKIARLEIVPDVVLHNSVFELNQRSTHWQLQLNADEVASRILFDKDWHNNGIDIAMEYLRLPLPPAAKSAEDEAALAQLEQLTQRWLLQVPPLTLSCGECSIGPYRFGKVQAKAHSTGDSWVLEQLNAAYKRHQLSVQGQWRDDADLGQSQFSGRLQSANLGAMLDEFQISSAVSGSTADIEYQLHWRGAPHQFRLASLGGDISYKLGEGALTEVSDQGARLFSIFSLDSLLRKLRLDFRDVFAKGFFYNNMKGNLALSQGVVQTSDASIDGVPGSLHIQGYADLVSEKLDYQMAFSPKVTSSLPVIIAWMVNPATGLAALALDEVFQSAEVISKINFTVTGSFDQPVVTEVNRHSKEVPVPVRVAQPDSIIEQPAPTDQQRKQPHG
jgi:uncharacterized protein (TIGR02099 family)